MTDTTALRAIAERGRDSLRYVLNFAATKTRISTIMMTHDGPTSSTTEQRLEALWTALPALLDHIDAQARALEEARAALEPFVDWCDHAPADAADNLVMFELTMPQTRHVTITVGHLRRARAASQSLARQEGVEG